MSTIFPVAVRIGAAMDGSFGAAFGGAEQRLGRVGDAVAKIGSQAAQVKSLQDMTRRSADLAKSWRDSRTAAAAYQSSLPRDQSQWTSAQVRHLEQLQSRTNAAAHAYNQLQRDINAARTDLRAAGVDIDRLAAEEARLGRETETLRGHYARLGRAVADLKAAQARRGELRGQLMDATALGGAIYGLTKPAVAFESAMSDVRKVIDFSDGAAGVTAMGDAIKDMSLRIPLSAQGLAGITAAGGRMGIGEKDILGYTETVAKLAFAWEMVPEQAGEAMAKIQNVMGFAMADLPKIGDAINKLDDASAAKAPEILDVLKRTSGMGKMFGLTTQQLAALGTTMIDLGRSPEVASTGINALMQKLFAAPTGTKKFQEALKSLGWSAKGMQDAIGKDAQGTLNKFLEKVSHLDKKKQVNVLAEMFGAEYSDDLAILIGGLDKYKKYLGIVGDETNYVGSSQAEFDARMGTAAAQLQVAGNAGQHAAESLGRALLPAIKVVATAIVPYAKAISDLAIAHPEVTQAIVGTVVAAMGLKILMITSGYVKTFGVELLAMGRIAKETAAAQFAMARMGGVVTPALGMATAATRAFGLALMATPVGWVAAGILAVAVAGLAIYKYWQPIKAFIGGIADGVVAAVTRLTGGMATAGAVMDPAVKAIGTALAWVGDKISQAVVWFSELTTPVNATATALDDANKAGARVGDMFGHVLVAAIGLATAPLRGLVTAVQTGWSALATAMGWDPGNVGPLWTAATDYIGKTVDAVSAWSAQAWQRLTDKIGFDPMPLIQSVWSPVGAFIGQVVDGIIAKIDAVMGWISQKLAESKQAISWLTLGAFGSDDAAAKPGISAAAPAPEKKGGWFDGWFGSTQTPAAANSNTPPIVGGAVATAKPGAVVAQVQSAPPAANSNVSPPATQGVLALAKPATAPTPIPVAAPAPQPITVTVAVNLALTASPDTAALAQQLQRTLMPEIETKVRQAIADAMRAVEDRRGAAMHD